jgi:endonuclease G
MRKSKSILPKICQKSGLLALLSGICLWLYYQADTSEVQPKTNTYNKDSTTQYLTQLLPAKSPGTFVQHSRFSLSYSEIHEQAEWVAYALSEPALSAKKFNRTGFAFIPDPKINSKSANPNDYSGSSYDRGHLCPAADMAYDSIALRETFYMSNISPQTKAFNQGVWRVIESNTRNWAKNIGHILVITGPVLSKPGLEQIGQNKVTVPVGFFKVIYTPQFQQAIGFIVPNQYTPKDPMQYAFNIDYIEQITNINFLPNLTVELQSAIESKLDLSFWNHHASYN